MRMAISAKLDKKNLNELADLSKFIYQKWMSGEKIHLSLIDAPLLLNNIETRLFKKLFRRFSEFTPLFIKGNKNEIKDLSDEVEEIAERAMIKVWEKYKNETFTESFTSWAKGVLKNTVKDYYKIDDTVKKTFRNDMIKIFDNSCKQITFENKINYDYIEFHDTLHNIMLKKVSDYYSSNWNKKEEKHFIVQKSREKIFEFINDITQKRIFSNTNYADFQNKVKDKLKFRINAFFYENPIPQRLMFDIENIIDSIEHKNEVDLFHKDSAVHDCILKSLKALGENCQKIIEETIREYKYTSASLFDSDTTRRTKDLHIKKSVGETLGYSLANEDERAKFYKALDNCRKDFQFLLAEFNCLDITRKVFI